MKIRGLTRRPFGPWLVKLEVCHSSFSTLASMPWEDSSGSQMDWTLAKWRSLLKVRWVVKHSKTGYFGLSSGQSHFRWTITSKISWLGGREIDAAKESIMIFWERSCMLQSIYSLTSPQLEQSWEDSETISEFSRSILCMDLLGFLICRHITPQWSSITTSWDAGKDPWPCS